ncbi:MAG: FHA domain-containing protein [Ardenticatenaceae bacterium]|nr:FHA domain-containing protein [Ardenticatenaceae bacterium]
MKRITFEIDFLGVSMEVAQVRSEVTIGQLVQEILVEFALEHPFLNQHQPQNYVLRTAVDSIDLPPDQAIHQIGKRSKLFFREKEVIVPETAVSIDQPFYLRYRSHVFKIGWTPALIGRPIPGDTDNARLAVDLEPFSLAVSRRQAEIVWADGRFAIRGLSENPMLINGVLLPFGRDSIDSLTQLQNGDTILLQRSGIALTCLQPDCLSHGRAAQPATGGAS